MGSRGVYVCVCQSPGHAPWGQRCQPARPTLTMTAGTLSPRTGPWPFCLPSSGVAPVSWALGQQGCGAQRTEGSGIGPAGLLGTRCLLVPSSTGASHHLSSLELCCAHPGCP